MSSGRMDAEVDRRIANASKAFGALRRAVFKDSNLTITTKRKVYLDAEVDRRIANASKAFGALRRAVFKDSNLIITTKRKVYKACVLSVLLYGSECWTPLRNHLNRLDAFHHRCIRTVLNITNKQQWEQRITSAMTRQKWGDPDTAADKVMKGRLEWLGHIARMADHRIPKLTLFDGFLRPVHLEDPANDGEIRFAATSRQLVSQN